MKNLTFGQKAADWLAAKVGSWVFVILQTIFLTFWILWNIYGPESLRFDPAPFILLNLMLSFQAAYTGPIIMISQNRQSEIDRKRAMEDFEVNKRAELEIEDIQGHLHRIEDSIEIVLQRALEEHHASAIFNMQVAAHEQTRAFEEHVWYPEHEPRKESPEFRKNKKILHDMDAPCYICGARRSQGAKIEIHHKLEWAFWNGFDHERIKKELGIDNPDAMENLMPLCEKHHRGRYTGIHCITGPVWEAQKWAAPGVSFTERSSFREHRHIEKQSKEDTYDVE